MAKKYTIIVDFLQIKKDIDRNKKILKDIGANSIIPIYRLENLPPPFFLDIPSMIIIIIILRQRFLSSND